MQVSVEDVNSVKKTLHIEIPQDTITEELDRAYDDLKKKTKLKGFRPGKVPRGVLEQYFKKNVHADVSSKLIQESFVEAIREKELKVVGSPKIDYPELKARQSYRYSATVDIRPEIADIDFEGLALKKTLYKATDQEVDTQLKMLQKKLAQQEPIDEDRPLKEDDFALIDFEGFKDGTPFPELQKAENFVLQVGRAQVLKAFDDNLIGMNPGDEKEFPITFPEDYANKTLANLEITFKVALKEIRKEILPEINDVFAKKLGDYKNIDELEAAITDDLTKGYQKRSDQELHEQAYDALLAKTEFEAPDSLVEHELENIISDTERYFAQHNIRMEDAGLTREKLNENYRELAVKQAKRHLILNKIVEQENLELSDEDLEAGFVEMSEAFRQPVDQIKEYYKDKEDRFEGFKQVLLEKQAIRLIIESSVIENVEPDAARVSEEKGDETE